MSDQNMTQKPLRAQNKFGVTAFFIYLAIFLAPNGKLFIIKVSEGLHLTPVRFVLIPLAVATTVHLLSNRLNIVPIIRRFPIFKPLILLLGIKIVSLLYTSNYLGGMAVIEWFIENIFFAAVCYIYYVKGIIVPSKIILFIVAGFVLSIFVAFLQIGKPILDFNLLLPVIDYVNLNTPEVNLFRITGLYMGDVNSYATYVAAVLISLAAVSVYSKKHLLGTAILFLAGTIVLYSIQSRSSIIIFILVLIYMIIRDRVLLRKQSLLFILIFLTFLSVILLSNTGDVFFEKYSPRYLRLINYINRVAYGEEENLQAHVNMLLIYKDIIDREPFAVITGCGEGDYLGRGGGSVKGGTGAHNAYVLILGENGPIAFLLFIYITWLILKASFFVNRNSSTPVAKFFLYFNLVYLLSFVLYGSQIHTYMFWMILGFTFAEKTRIDTNKRIRKRSLIA